MGCLDDVVALIHCPPDPVANARAAIAARIEKHGGKVAARLSKDTSHIIWERRHSRRPSEKAADEADLLELFRKLEKVGAGLVGRDAVCARSPRQPPTAGSLH